MQIRAKVKPNSKKGSLVLKSTDESGEFFEIHVRDPAIDGKANLAVIKVLSKYFKVSKSRISIKSGSRSKFKIFEIDI